MNLSTKYLGLKLKNPIVPSASPLSNNVDTVKQMEDNGAAAVVMYSLFEEQITHESDAVDMFLMQGADSFSEALSYFPQPEEFHNKDAEEYLNQVAALKSAVDIPIIGSLNGVSAGGWMDYAKKIEQAGADALELNVYYVPTDPRRSSADIENMYVEDLKTVKSQVGIPVAIKLSPYFSALANMAKQLDDAGADGLVLFNRFYQPDLDLDALEVKPDLEYSRPYDLRLPLRWLAILKPFVKASLAATSGIHDAAGVLKALMAGADVTMLASVLMQKGVGQIASILKEMEEWMEAHEYTSVAQMQGSMSHASVAEPAAYERANYMKVLQSIK